MATWSIKPSHCSIMREDSLQILTSRNHVCTLFPIKHFLVSAPFALGDDQLIWVERPWAALCLSDCTVLFTLSWRGGWRQSREKMSGQHISQLASWAVTAIVQHSSSFKIVSFLSDQNMTFFKSYLVAVSNFVPWNCLVRCCLKWFYDRFLNEVLKMLKFFLLFLHFSSFLLFFLYLQFFPIFFTFHAPHFSKHLSNIY